MVAIVVVSISRTPGVFVARRRRGRKFFGGFG
jgi:hypothetical protein